MATPTIGTIPALTEYQPGALTIASTIFVEIVNSANATTAASFRMAQADFVGKAPSIMLNANPVAGDLVAFYQVANSLPKVTSIGNLSIPSGNLPTGGGTGTILSKASATNYNASWVNISTLVSAGTSIAVSGSTTVTIGVTNFGISSSQIATNAVGNVQFRQGTAKSVIGVAGNATANIADIVPSAGTQVLLSNAGNTGILFGPITTAMLPVQFQVAAFTSWGVAVTNATGALTGTNFGTTGMFLMGNGSSAAPTFSLINLSASTSVSGVLNVINGGHGTSALTPFGVITGGTTIVGITAAGATGQLFVGQATTTPPVWLPASSTVGFIMQSLGSTANPQWVGSGGVLLNTITASQLGSAVDTTSFTSRYSRFRIAFENICPVSTATLTCSLNLQVATSGTSWIAASYVSNIQANVGLTTVLAGTTSLFLLTGATATTCVGTSTLYGVNGHIEIVNPANAVFRKSINGDLNYITPGGVSTLTQALSMPSGFWDGASNAIVSFAVAFQTGNISTGTIRVYGIA